MAPISLAPPIDSTIYKKRVWAWTMYDWANSAFATTILAAVLPVYFSQVAGATLPSTTIATSYWSFGLSISLIIVAILSPILGTISDIMRGKKRFLAFFAGIGILGTALLVFVESGDWLLASFLAIIGRIGFNGANSFYDALLPHVATTDDRDRVSARGYAMGYLGGGLLLAINVAMLQFLPGTWGARLSFLSVAIWWAVFSIPLFRLVPEPPAAVAKIKAGSSVIRASFSRLGETIRDMRQYRELFKFLVAFLIYNDGIGTIIGVAAIYGSELGFGDVELILALLLVQFVGIPYSLIFGRLPSQKDRFRPLYLAFIIFNLVALPLAGVIIAKTLPANQVGATPAKFETTATAFGEGSYFAIDMKTSFSGNWSALNQITELTLPKDGEIAASYAATNETNARFDFVFHGQSVKITYSRGPDHGIWAVWMDGQPLIEKETNQPIQIDAYQPTLRFEESQTFKAANPGEHRLSLVNTGKRATQSQGNILSLTSIHVLPAIRQSNLGLILGMILAIQAVGFVLAWLLGPFLFSGLAEKMNTQRGVLLALVIYAVIAVWGYFINSVVEFWFLAWMVSVVQGGSQALSRSLYATMSPAAKSGEFFGLFGVMEKFSAILGPLLFGLAGTFFGSSRPAVLSIIAFFIVGGIILTRVNVEEGKRVAQAEDASLLIEGQA